MKFCSLWKKHSFLLTLSERCGPPTSLTQGSLGGASWHVIALSWALGGGVCLISKVIHCYYSKWKGLEATLLAAVFGASLRELKFDAYENVEKAVDLVLFHDSIWHPNI